MTAEKHPLEIVREALEKIVRRGYDSYHDVDMVSKAIVVLTTYLCQPQSCAECERLGRENARLWEAVKDDAIVQKYAADNRGVDVEAFNLIDELSGAFDDQTYSQKKSHDFDAPDDAEFTINVTAKQLRDIDNIASRGILRTTPEDAKEWREMITAPKNEALFLCRKKSKPHVTFEAALFRESESYEMPEEYEVFQDMTADQPITDEWSNFEWMPLPAAPQPEHDKTGGEV